MANRYDDIWNMVQQELTSDERRRLAEELTQQVGQTTGKRSILELRGLGKESWEGIDPDEHVAKERDSWSG